jgi:chromosomal replication initiator protein
VELAKEALKDLLAVQNRQISIENIQKTVADYYKIKVADMYSKKRTRVVARPRQMAMFLARELTEPVLPGNRPILRRTRSHHGPARLRQDRGAESQRSDPGLRKDYSLLIQVLTG